MAFYDFYRQNLPGGGGLVTPPQPFYQPQPSWGGLDFYRAQAQAADSSLYEYGLERVRGLNFTQGVTGIGVGAGIEEAKILHQRAYFGEMKPMMPADIGAAAAYEAWRSWSTYQGTYMQPLSADRDRQREALIGMAIGEAARLWNYTANPMDMQGRLVAVEGAAATAAKIFVQTAAGMGAGAAGMGGMGVGGSPLLGAGAGLGMAGSSVMGPGAGAGLGVGGYGGGLSPGIGVGAMGAGDYLNVPRPMMRRRSMSDVGLLEPGYGAGMGAGMGGMGMGGMGTGMGALDAGVGGMGAGMAGMGAGMAGMGAGIGGMGGGMGYGGGMGGGMGYGSGYGSGGMGYGGMGGGSGYGGAGMMPGGGGYGGAGYGMGGTGHPLAASAGLLAGELEGRHRRRRSRSRHRHRRRRSYDGGLMGAELGQGVGGGYGGYGGGGYGGYGGGYGGYGHHGGALAAGLAAGAQGYAYALNAFAE